MNGKQPLGVNSLRALSGIHRILGKKEGRQTDQDIVEALSYPPDPSESWKTLKAQRKNLLSLPYPQLAKISLDLSQSVNKGMYDFLRFANPGHLIRYGGTQDEIGTQAFLSRLDTLHGSAKSLIDSMWSGIFLTGALFIELVLDPSGRMPVDIAVNDPNTARFIRYKDPIRGNIWRLAQETKNGLRILDDNPLVKYLGFDRLTDNPFGRPVVGPAVHASIVLLSIIEILQKTLANQAISRTDYEVDAEQLLMLIDRNPDLAGNDDATAEFINEQIESIKNIVENLGPDSNYIHLSTVKVNYATSPMTSNIEGLDAIIDKLLRDVVNGFKGISALSNILDSTTETHIQAQLEYYTAALTSLQDEVDHVLTQFLNIANRVQGIPSDVRFHFKRQRSTDKTTEAQIEKIKTETIISKLEAGIITPQEAKIEIEGLREELVVTS